MVWGYIGITICIFYLLRNWYVSNFMIPCGEHIVNVYNRAVKYPYLWIKPKLRNYYLLVLNPFLWRFLDIYENDEEGRKIKVLWKQFSKEQKNLRNFK